MIDPQMTALEKVADLEFEIQQHLAEMYENLFHPRVAWAHRQAANKARKLAKEISSWIYEEAFRLAFEAGDEEAYVDPSLLREKYGKALKYVDFIDQKIDRYAV